MDTKEGLRGDYEEGLSVFEGNEGGNQKEYGEEGATDWVMMSEEGLLGALRSGAEAAGGVNKLALRLGVSGQYLSMVMSGRKGIGPKILEGLRARKVVMYEIEVMR